MKSFAYLNIGQNVLILVFSIFFVLFLKMGLEGAIIGLVIIYNYSGNIITIFYQK